MFLDKKLIIKIRTTSGASRKKLVQKVPLLIDFKHKRLSTSFKNSAGRSLGGRITTFSKGRITKKVVVPRVNKTFRDKSISFISNFSTNSMNSALSSLVFSASGSISYVPSSTSHSLFRLTYLSSLELKKSDCFMSVISLRRFILIKPTFFTIFRLPKNQFVSNLELYPGKGMQYACSPGVRSHILKMDTRTGAALAKLPSGVRKVFSIYSLGALGRPSLKDNHLVNITSAGHKRSKGFKPQTRGVAKNPVDHPHGGRTKSIKYPRTPWGKTTKFK